VHVIATRWTQCLARAPAHRCSAYTELTMGGNLDPAGPPQPYIAVREFRLEHPADLRLWATHIHLGRPTAPRNPAVGVGPVSA
jgi:hypothetical protein